MNLSQLIVLVLGVLLSLLGAFFSYMKIGESETELDIPLMGKIKTAGTGLILILVGAGFIYLSQTKLKELNKIEEKQAENPPKGTHVQKHLDSVENSGDDINQTGNNNLQINKPTESIQINFGKNKADSSYNK